MGCGQTSGFTRRLGGPDVLEKMAVTHHLLHT